MKVIDITHSPNILSLEQGSLLLYVPDTTWSTRWIICLDQEEAEQFRLLENELEAAWPNSTRGKETESLFFEIVKKLETFFYEASLVIGWLFDPVLLQESKP
ncbi:hypothetical protein KC571_02050 [candidate division WWE3 bacterium]|uniref:Uncharacterized protein n=1 Tax=candidate division WWE3 bacterium TaxID=2053526 RepID=A0A955RP87_UNCKA|nr:hypothetical protein [candidate division WWE3 bacterium]